MATTSSSGIVGGSQIDAAGLASQLVAAERAPLDAQIQRDTTRVTTQISALGTLKSALSTFQSALASLKTTKAFSVRSATSSDTSVFTATATSAAADGTYGIEVTQLATAHQLASKAFASGSTQVVGTGTLTVSLGASSFAVTIDSTNSTVAGIRDAINSAADNTGVRATLVQATDGAHLVLASTRTGATNSIQVAQTGGDGGLAQLTYAPLATTNYTQLSAALDSIVKVATFEHTSSTNTVTDAIDGVTLNLAAQAPGTTLTLTVSDDHSTATSHIKSFVSAYNALESQIIRLRSYDSASRTGGPMLGDSLLNGIESQLRRTLTQQVSGLTGQYQSLSSIGITTQADGTLAVDDTKLQTALTSSFDTVASIFGSTNGVAAQLDSQLTKTLATGSGIDSRSTSLVKQQKQITDHQAVVDDRMATLQSQYLKQFTALDTLLSQLQTTSSYLTQQLDSLSNLGRAIAK